MFRLGQDRGDQHGAGVSAQRDIVVVQRMRRSAVDPGGLGGRGLAVAEGQGRRTVAGARVSVMMRTLSSLRPAIIVPMVSMKPMRAIGGLFRQTVGRQIGDELAEGPSQRHAGFLRIALARVAFSMASDKAEHDAKAGFDPDFQRRIRRAVRVSPISTRGNDRRRVAGGFGG